MNYEKLMNQYSDTYQMMTTEDNIRGIRCNKSYGFIIPYSFDGNELLFVSGNHFNSVRKKTSRLKMLPNNFLITQEGDTDFCVKFPAKLLNLAEELFSLRKRVQRDKSTYNTKGIVRDE